MKKTALSRWGLMMIGWTFASFNLFAQQNIQFSQYLFNGLSLNPGYAGYKEALNLTTTYRNQWTGLNGAPVTFSASVDGVIRQKSIGLGLSVVNDKLGPQTSTYIFATISYRVKLSDESRLSVGLSSGLDQYSMDNTSLVTIRPEPSLNALMVSRLRPDLRIGLFFASAHYFAGLSALDLISYSTPSDPSYFIIRKDKHYYLHAGAIFRLSEAVQLKPSFLIKDDFRGPANLDLNAFLIFQKNLWVGGAYRTAFKQASVSTFNQLSGADAASVLVEYFPNSCFRLGYSFDYTTSRLQEVSAGSHELSIGYTFQSKRYPMLSPRLF